MQVHGLSAVGVSALLMLAACNSDGGGSSASGTNVSGSVGETGSTSDVTASTTNTTNTPSTSNTTSPSTTETPTTGETDPTDAESETTGIPACPYTPVEGNPPVAFEQVAEGFSKPLLVVGHPTEPDRLFVVEQIGDIYLLEPGMTTRPATPFLHVDTVVSQAGTISSEQGLLGLALHPNFPTDPRLYVSYTSTAASQATTVDEYTVNGNTPTFTRTIIAVSQPAVNHNGGMIQFGPDDYLYFGLGDGGGGGDQNRYARNPSLMLGKILRIGVEPDGQPDNPGQCGNCPAINAAFDYTIPPDNPFVGDGGVLDEAFAIGLRNPWRFAFDRDTGLLYAADVGQGGVGFPEGYEEVDLIEAGHDYGWSDMEGTICFNANGCDTNATPNQVNANGLTSPLAEYRRGGAGNRCSVTGLGVYRSCEVPEWGGTFFYADLCSGGIDSVRWANGAAEVHEEVANLPGAPLGGGYNAHGDVFIATGETTFLSPAGNGRIYRIVPGT